MVASEPMSGAETFFGTFGAVVAFAAATSYLNHRYLHLPSTIALMAAALLGSLGIVALGTAGVVDQESVRGWVESLDFGTVFLQGILGYLLFAGALHINLTALRGSLPSIASFATFSVVLSAFLVGVIFWQVARWIGFDLPFIYALTFGAVVAPTDPVAVLGILGSVRAPRRLSTTIAGESLFNDGVGVVVFLTVASVAASGHSPDLAHVGTFFLEEAVGGAVIGLALGFGAYWLMRTIDEYTVEVLLSLALVSGGYAFAAAIHVSGPIAIVVAGIIIGNQGRATAMSETTKRYLDHFWELVDEILTAVLFVLVGIVVIDIELTEASLLAGALAVPIGLAARLVSLSLPGLAFHLVGIRTFDPKTVVALTWGGLRGGVSVALALSLPPSDERDLIVTASYVVVAFAVLVQGLTFGRLVERLFPSEEAESEAVEAGAEH